MSQVCTDEAFPRKRNDPADHQGSGKKMLLRELRPISRIPENERAGTALDLLSFCMYGKGRRTAGNNLQVMALLFQSGPQRLDRAESRFALFNADRHIRIMDVAIIHVKALQLNPL